MKGKATPVSIKRLNIARQDEDTTKMEKELLDRITRSEIHIHTMKSECRRLCNELGDVAELDQMNAAYIKQSFSQVMVRLSFIIHDFEGWTQDLIDLMEANTRSTHVVNAYVKFDFNRCQNFKAKLIQKFQDMTQEVINIKASLEDKIPATNEDN
ncbi:hypothetical protein AAHA92_14707 [Salvia divinorum]|uniref:Uncharacterized protein n=1 Tax=Salvia divinorum TaxID=28513 RepID=A0ABD1HCE7_SALDI